MKINSVLLIVCGLLAGCSSLPLGDPPIGPITGPAVRPGGYSWDGAENYMLTSLALYCMQHFPAGAGFYLEIAKDNTALEYRTYAVIRALRDYIPVRLGSRAGADYTLRSTADVSGTWVLSLENNKTGKTVWIEKLTVKGEQ
ncbi:MAG: hypothetical protein PHV59_05875 [Victivallales bacterium]|nr:hypothetical protein [Victivallales bacterium]